MRLFTFSQNRKRAAVRWSGKLDRVTLLGSNVFVYSSDFFEFIHNEKTSKDPLDLCP